MKNTAEPHLPIRLSMAGARAVKRRGSSDWAFQFVTAKGPFADAMDTTCASIVAYVIYTPLKSKARCHDKISV